MSGVQNVQFLILFNLAKVPMYYVINRWGKSHYYKVYLHKLLIAACLCQQTV